VSPFPISLIRIANETLSIIDRGWSENRSGVCIELRAAVEAAVAGTKLYRPAYVNRLMASRKDVQGLVPDIQFTVSPDCIYICSSSKLELISFKRCLFVSRIMMYFLQKMAIATKTECIRRPIIMQTRKADLFFATLLIACLLTLANTSINCIAQAHEAPEGAVQGYITLDDGIRLFYQKVGNGPKIVIIPNGQSMIKDFGQFADRNHTLIFYDLRSRGRSDQGTKNFEGGVHLEVEDLDAVRRHFKINKAALIGHSYLGLMVALYAMKHPMHVEQVI
jgi:hypothetical protein